MNVNASIRNGRSTSQPAPTRPSSPAMLDTASTVAAAFSVKPMETPASTRKIAIDAAAAVANPAAAATGNNCRRTIPLLSRRAGGLGANVVGAVSPCAQSRTRSTATVMAANEPRQPSVELRVGTARPPISDAAGIAVSLSPMARPSLRRTRRDSRRFVAGWMRPCPNPPSPIPIPSWALDTDVPMTASATALAAAASWMPRFAPMRSTIGASRNAARADATKNSPTSSPHTSRPICRSVRTCTTNPPVSPIGSAVAVAATMLSARALRGLNGREVVIIRMLSCTCLVAS